MRPRRAPRWRRALASCSTGSPIFTPDAGPPWRPPRCGSGSVRRSRTTGWCAADLPTMEADVELRWLPVAKVRATSTQRLLFEEQVFPVCHPSLLPDRRLDLPEVLE